MKRICTQIATLCLLVIAQNVYAQTNSLAISKTNPAPTPGFGIPDSVNSVNGFVSTNTGTFQDFAPFQTDTIISPQYYYNAPQTVINFVYNCSAAASGVGTTPTALIITAAGDTLSATASQTIKGASVDYYFTFNLATSLPANMDFKIALIMDLGPKAVTANTLATNALRPTAQAPLPVNFIGFYAKKANSGVSLTWNVCAEMNVSGYEIQRSTDGNSFSKIGFVPAGSQSSYSFTDSKPTATAYYRIKSIDIDGGYKYSTIVGIKDGQSNVVLKAFPTPVQNQLTVQHSSAISSGKIEVLSVDGRLIKSLSLSAGVQQTSVDLSSAKAGVYIIRFINDNSIESLKIVKQ